MIVGNRHTGQGGLREDEVRLVEFGLNQWKEEHEGALLDGRLPEQETFIRDFSNGAFALGMLAITEGIDPAQSDRRLWVGLHMAPLLEQAVTRSLEHENGPVRSVLEANPPFRTDSAKYYEALMLRQVGESLLGQLVTVQETTGQTVTVD